MSTRTLPPEGWTEPDNRGHVTYTEHGYPRSHPEREGFVAYFIARHGLDYTTWTYKPVEVEVDMDDESAMCQGHESLDGAHMGEAVYCDGSCRSARRF